MSDDHHDQRLRIAIEHAMDESATLAEEVLGIATRLPTREQGHIHHLRSIANRLDKLTEALGLELASPGELDREGSKALATWGKRLGTAALATIALAGHGGITRTGEVAAEYLLRTLSEVVQTADEPTTPADRLGHEFRERRRALQMSSQEVAQQLGFSRQYYSGIENGRSIPAQDKLTPLLEVLEFDEAERVRLAELHDEARRARSSSRLSGS